MPEGRPQRDGGSPRLAPSAGAHRSDCLLLCHHQLSVLPALPGMGATWPADSPRGWAEEGP